MSRKKVKVKSCIFSLFRREEKLYYKSDFSYYSTSFTSSFSYSSFSSSQTCHWCMGIVLIKYYFTGGKSCKNMLFVVNSLFVVTLFIMNIMVSIRGNFTKYTKKLFVFFSQLLRETFVFHAIILGKVFSPGMCPCVNKKKEEFAFLRCVFGTLAREVREDG